MFDFNKINPFRQKSIAKKVIRRSSKKMVLTEALFCESIAKKVPLEAIEYCTSLWKEHPFSFAITKTRSTCLGNYKYQDGAHTITINHDLNLFNFLITYIHEVAHQRVFMAYKEKKRPSPHGVEWKNHFQFLMTPLLNETIFPLEILKPLALHMKNPPASSTRDHKLMKAIKLFNSSDKTNIYHLEDVSDMQTFLFKNRKFQKLEKRRTRALCLELQSERKYTIPLMAEVKPIIE